MRLIPFAASLLLSTAFAVPFASEGFAQTGETSVAEVAAVDAEAEATTSATMVVANAEGEAVGEYSLTDYTVSVSRTFAYDTNELRGEVSLYITVASPVDRGLLEWARTQVPAADSTRSVVVRAASDLGSDTIELEAARITSISLNSAMGGASLQISAQRMVVDGVALN